MISVCTFLHLNFFLEYVVGIISNYILNSILCTYTGKALGILKISHYINFRVVKIMCPILSLKDFSCLHGIWSLITSMLPWDVILDWMIYTIEIIIDLVIALMAAFSKNRTFFLVEQIQVLIITKCIFLHLRFCYKVLSKVLR